MARKPLNLVKLDATTPKWPELRVQDDPNGPHIYISGIGHPLDDDDPQSDAIERAGHIAAQQGAPIRLTATDPDGSVTRMIVTADRSVHLLDTARPPGSEPDQPHIEAVTTSKAGKVKKAKPVKKTKTSTGPLAQLSPTTRTIVKWSALVFVLLVVASAVALIVRGASGPDDEPAAAVVAHPAPPAGQLYTETAPPTWNPQATWVLPIADNTTPVVDPATGTIAVLTPNDRTTTETETATSDLVEAREPGWLSILEPDGTTRWTYPLDRRPRYGPVIVDIDSVPSVVIGTTAGTVTTWPLTGGQPATIDLPDGVTGQLNTTGTTLMATLTEERLAVLRAGRFEVFPALPRTEPVYAIDNAVISIQPETGTWWTQQADNEPIPTTPNQPVGADQLDSIIAITPAHVILAWNTVDEDGEPNDSDTVTAYDRTTGDIIATITPDTPIPTSSGTGLTNTAGTITATNGITLINGTLRDVPQLRVTSVQGDQVHGTLQSDPIVITDGRIEDTTPATLIPVSVSAQHALVISQNQLYALPQVAQ